MSQTAPTPTPENPPWEIFIAAQGGLRTDQPGPGGAMSLGVNRRLGRFLRPELLLGLGAYSVPTEVLTLIRIGLRVEWPLEGRFKPYLWLAFAHDHQTAWELAKQAPLQHVLGLSESGVQHRSGFDAGLGFAYELPRQTKDGLAGRLGVRAVFTQMLGAGPARTVELTLTAGVCL